MIMQPSDGPGRTITTVDDGYLAEHIERSHGRVVYVAPGLGIATAKALVARLVRQPTEVAMILDDDPEICRIGFGDAEALEIVKQAVEQHGLDVQGHRGLRIGLLITDEGLVIWSPTARSVDADAAVGKPNAIVLSGPVVETVRAAVSPAAGGSGSAPEIGKGRLTTQALEVAIKDLKQNPPAPFDLARRTRVFSTRFQFVELEMRGAEWTERRIRLSNLLLNADLPTSLQPLLETQIRPFQTRGDLAFEVPHVIRGKRAFDEDGSRITVPTKQAEILKCWDELRTRYLWQLKGFGWLIRKDRLAAFRSEIEAFEETLRAWVDAFKAHAAKHEGVLVNEIVEALKGRLDRAQERKLLDEIDLPAEVRKGLDRLRVIEPRVRMVLKDVSWESSRDGEFMGALRSSVPAEELEGWFTEFNAAIERPTRMNR
jgi:hypothetical protein